MKLVYYTRAQAGEIPLDAWRKLARRACVSNPFYEHWNLLPALQHLELQAEVTVVTAWKDDELVALFPLHFYLKLPLFQIAYIWKHDECFCTSPLVLDKKTWSKLLPQVLEQRGIHMLISTTQAKQAFVPKHSLHSTRCSYRRPALDASLSFPEMEASWSKKRRKDGNRLLQKTFKKMQANYSNNTTASDCSAAFEQYKNIEVKGWKGRSGSALTLHPATDRYYQAVIKEGSAHQKVQMQLLSLPEKVIAASLRLVTNDCAFEVKTSYCEDNRNLSPGVMLEMLNMRQLSESTLSRADSCTLAGNRILEALWPKRIAIYNSVYFGDCFSAKLAWHLTRVHKYFRHRNKDNKRLAFHPNTAPENALAQAAGHTDTPPWK